MLPRSRDHAVCSSGESNHRRERRQAGRRSCFQGQEIMLSAQAVGVKKETSWEDEHVKVRSHARKEDSTSHVSRCKAMVRAQRITICIYKYIMFI